MIKTLSLTIALCLILSFAGCRKTDDISSNLSSVQSVTAVSSESDFESNTEENKIETSSQETTSEKAVSSETQKDVVAETSSSSQSSESVSKPKDTQTSSVVSDNGSQKTESITPLVPQIQNATASDSKEIAVLIAKFINEYRNKCDVEDAIILPGLTEYAEYRSRQLVSNFSHDTNDERAAATALKYGRYIEPSLYGMTGEPYYTACSGEAIVKAGYAGTKEYVAESIATLVANSIAHWTYVGNSTNKYIAVGVTYESGLWYCDIAVSDVNYDETS